MTAKQISQHLFDTGPKRVLALDGGGIRGILTLQVLERIERLVRDRTNNKSATLSDYFDLIGGTSTGSIIAAGLALGWPVSKIQKIYVEFGKDIFDSSWFRKGVLRPKFSDKVLEEQLEKNFKGLTLGGAELETGLAIVMKRLDTGSPWIVHNNPRGKYFGAREGSGSIPNKDYKISDLVRASSAAPTYFEPKKMDIAAGQQGLFVDGGVSPHNNPSLLLMMLATLKGHGLQWPTGEDALLMVSVGTGNAIAHGDPEDIADEAAAKLGILALSALMEDASSLNETMMQWISRSPTARRIDSEVGDLSVDSLGGEPLLTYLRYQAWLDVDWLSEELGMNFSKKDVESLQEMDKPRNIDKLTEIGVKLAAKKVEELHFPNIFDI